ncbi:MAG TPA: histidine kinase dimerization/phospho-acceptor domain-containing protein, partial [Vicinamibacterales bacterium]|nr:histidine kinase dimerization/phospho-acceptor domain-containing protein [Vicinamibacterales bacterium]
MAPGTHAPPSPPPAGTAAPPAAQDTPADGQRRRLVWLIALRPLLVGAILGAGLFVDSPSPKGLPREFALYLLEAVGALSVLYAFSRRIHARWPWLVEAQLVIDVCVVSSIVILTGGFHSDFVALYVLPILGGSVLRLSRGGMTIAMWSGVSFGLIVASQYGLVIPRPEHWGLTNAILPLPSPRYAFYSVSVHIIAFSAVARLTGYLAQSLHRSDQNLRAASSAIADLQAFNQLVIDSMSGGLAATDADGRVVMFNRAAEAITGHHAALVRGRSAVEILQLPGELRGALAEVVATGRGRRVIYPYTLRDGNELQMGLTLGPLMTAAGAGYLFTFQDVTELKRLEREAETQKRLAAVGQMAAGIAHEIRNPLASMSGSMQVLRQELQLEPDQAQLFDIVLRESDRLNQTIRDFLSYARPSQGQAATVDMATVVRDAARLLRNSPDCTAAHRIECAAEGTTTLQAVEAQMRQIVWNLATNALRAMPDGGTLRLHVGVTGSSDAATSVGGQAVVLSVRDDGVGIP